LIALATSEARSVHDSVVDNSLLDDYNLLTVHEETMDRISSMIQNGHQRSCPFRNLAFLRLKPRDYVFYTREPLRRSSYYLAGLSSITMIMTCYSIFYAYNASIAANPFVDFDNTIFTVNLLAQITTILLLDRDAQPRFGLGLVRSNA
jgi:hypothetical protein